jgi:hypothetical protein
MFKKAFDLTFPSVEYSLSPSKAEKYEDKTYYISVFIIPKHITITNH